MLFCDSGGGNVLFVQHTNDTETDKAGRQAGKQSLAAQAIPHRTCVNAMRSSCTRKLV